VEAELNAIGIVLHELAEQQAEIKARLREIQERLNELQMEGSADESESD